MTAVFANFASSTLGAAITSGATSLTVRSGTGDLFPTPTGLEFFYLVLENRTSTGTTRESAKARPRVGMRPARIEVSQGPPLAMTKARR